jgi:hypothetical protein
LLEIHGLVNGTRETVDQVVLGRVGEESIDEDLYSELEGYEATFVHDLADLVAITSPLKFKTV